MKGFLRFLRFGWLRNGLRGLHDTLGSDDERLSSGARPPQGARRAGRRKR